MANEDEGCIDMVVIEYSDMEETVSVMMEDNGWDLNHDNFKETPRRYASWLSSFYSTMIDARVECEKYFEKKFKTENDELVVVGPIRVHSLCPHHLLPIFYDVFIGVVLDGTALGLSKYARIAKTLGRFPYIQEDYTTELSDLFMRELDPRGVAVLVDGDHLCMKIRGVEEKDARTVTSNICGVFKNPPEGKDPKGEFMNIVLGRKN